MTAPLAVIGGGRTLADDVTDRRRVWARRGMESLKVMAQDGRDVAETFHLAELSLDDAWTQDRWVGDYLEACNLLARIESASTDIDVLWTYSGADDGLPRHNVVANHEAFLDDFTSRTMVEVDELLASLMGIGAR